MGGNFRKREIVKECPDYFPMPVAFVCGFLGVVSEEDQLCCNVTSQTGIYGLLVTKLFIMIIDIKVFDTSPVTTAVFIRCI